MAVESEKGGSLAGAASEQVRAIVEAAEQAAAQIRARSEDEASRVRAEAERGASRIRAEAERHATRIKAQEQGDIRALLDSIRGGLSRLSADLDQLEEKLAGGADAAAEAGAAAPARGADDEAARLVALNMALNGKTRDEVGKHL